MPSVNSHAARLAPREFYSLARSNLRDGLRRCAIQGRQWAARVPRRQRPGGALCCQRPYLVVLAAFRLVDFSTPIYLTILPIFFSLSHLSTGIRFTEVVPCSTMELSFYKLLWASFVLV